MALKNEYNNQVFINCPFDDTYLNLYRACIFTIIDSGFIPRCSREINNANQSRLDNIVKLIRECRFGIHDLSRVELDEKSNLPRFNMSLELGIFYGSQRFGNGDHKKKCSLILERDPYRYQQFISDISGIDVTAHNNSTREIIINIRGWLHTASRRTTIPIGEEINRKFDLFQLYINETCNKRGFSYDAMSFIELVDNMTDWLRYNQESGTPVMVE